MKLPPVWIMLGLNVVLTVMAQSFLRAGMSGVASADESTPIQLAWRVGTNGFVVGGIVTFGVSLLLWLALLAKMKISALYPMQQSLVFLGIQFVAWKWLGEGVSVGRLIGVGVICFGVFLVARG